MLLPGVHYYDIVQGMEMVISKSETGLHTVQFGRLKNKRFFHARTAAISLRPDARQQERLGLDTNYQQLVRWNELSFRVDQTVPNGEDPEDWSKLAMPLTEDELRTIGSAVHHFYITTQEVAAAYDKLNVDMAAVRRIQGEEVAPEILSAFTKADITVPMLWTPQESPTPGLYM